MLFVSIPFPAQTNGPRISYILVQSNSDLGILATHAYGIGRHVETLNAIQIVGFEKVGCRAN